MKNLHTSAYYKEYDHDHEDYQKSQISRHNVKKHYRQQKTYYEQCSELLHNIPTDDIQMVCLGTRNETEQNMFREILNNKNVSSCDIIYGAKLDFINGEPPGAWNVDIQMKYFKNLYKKYLNR